MDIPSLGGEIMNWLFLVAVLLVFAWTLLPSSDSMLEPVERERERG
jgi:hypothetical protein